MDTEKRLYTLARMPCIDTKMGKKVFPMPWIPLHISFFMLLYFLSVVYLIMTINIQCLVER